MDLSDDKWIFIWSGLGGGVVILLASLAAIIAYFCARHNNQRRAGGGLPYLPLYDEEAAIPRGRKGKGGLMSAEASMREYLEDSVLPSPESQQHRIREEEALMNARYYLRSSMAAMDTSLPGIGHRKRKFSFLVRHPQRGVHLMTMVHRGFNCVLSFGSDSGKATFSNLLQSLRHPYVCPTLDADFLAEKEMAVIFRAFHPKGSLKDLIYRASPKGRYSRKYSCVGNPLHPKTIALFGRQILEGLAFFQSKGFMYGHLHAGNVILDNSTCRLTDYENSLLNVMPRLQPFFLLLPDRQPDVVAFAHLLFEMAAGRELTAHDQVNDDTLSNQPQVLDILKRVLGLAIDQEEALRTVTEVLNQPFFYNVQLRHHSMKKTRIDSKGLDMLKAAHRTSIIGKDDFLALEGEHELGRSLRRSIRGERRGRRSGASSPRSLANSASSTPRGGSGVVSPRPASPSLLSASAPAHRLAPLLYSPPAQRDHHHHRLPTPPSRQEPPAQDHNNHHRLPSPRTDGGDDEDEEKRFSQEPPPDQQQQQHDGPAGQDDDGKEEPADLITIAEEEKEEEETKKKKEEEDEEEDEEQRGEGEHTDAPLERLSPPAPAALSSPLPPLVLPKT